ncbi:MAG: HIT family protein [Cytophagales bacterium]|nr:MAG: HIT family protein [Cytophagales bacterium]
MASVFSKIISREIPGYIIAEDDRFIAFLDVFPLVIGHALVVPKKEIDYLYDLEDKDLGDINVFAKKIAIALKKAIPCKRIGVAVIGLEVPHAHIHLVPMQNVGDINFSKPKIKVSEATMIETLQKIQSFL